LALVVTLPEGSGTGLNIDSKADLVFY